MSRRPGAPRALAHSALAAWLLASMVVAPPWLPAAQAAPKGEKVVKGKAEFIRDGDVTVIRTGKRTIIDYTGFDILSHETVRFEQPGKKSRVFNRVSGDATHIDGKLSGNGIVYIVNPAGVFLGRTAVVKVQRLVAAAGDLPDRDFLKNRDAFTLTGPVENLGAIDASSVALLGRTVANHGSIVAPDGVIALVAGDRVVLTSLEGGISIEVDGPTEGAENGIQQTGLVDAAGGSARFAVGDHYSLALNHTGMTRASDIGIAGGDGGLVKVSGTLDASAPAPGEKGGSVRVTGDLVQLEDAHLDASGAAGGGEIRVGGDVRGEGPMRNARRTFVDADSTLRADALVEGNGGSAVVYADEATAFHGQISARGGAAGGDGGFAELSGGQLADEGSADLTAAAGKAGTLLYDPQDIQIVGGTPAVGDGSDTPDTSPDRLAQATAGQVLFADVGEGGANPFLIYESEIEGTNANIVLEARNSITAAGTFDHQAASEGAGVLRIVPDNDFTLRTRNQTGDSTGGSAAPGIDLTTSTHGAALEVRTGGDGVIGMETGTAGTATPPSAVEAAPIRVGVLTTGGGNVVLGTQDGSIESGRIDVSGAPGATGVRGGGILLDAGDKDGVGGTFVTVTGDLIAKGGNGTSGNGGNGGNVILRTRLADNPGFGGGPVTLNGNIDVSGGNGTGRGGNGGNVLLDPARQGALVAGNITGTGGTGGTDATSVGGNGGRVDVSTTTGNLTLGTVDVSGGATAGGDEAAGGGFGGQVLVNTELQGDITTGHISTHGGDALSTNASDGGNGGDVTVRSVSGNIAIGGIDTSGGATDGAQVDGDGDPLEFGGTGGEITLNAGTGTTGTGNLTLNGNLVLLGGASPVADGVGLGGNADIRAKGAIEHGGQAGPHVTTQANVVFNASDVGAQSPIVVSGGGTTKGLLGLGADHVAQVAIDEGTFDDIQVVAYGTAADVQVVEGADQIIRIQNSQLVEADSTAHHADLTLGLQDRREDTVDDGDPNVGDDDVDGITFTLRTGSIRAGGNVRVLSEDDIVVGDAAGTVAVMNTRPPDPDPDADPDAPPPPPTSGALVLVADQDGDQVGQVRDGVAGLATGAMDLKGDAQESGGLVVFSRGRIGALDNPIGTVNGGKVAMLSRTAEDIEADEGIFLRNDGGGDLSTDTISVPLKTGGSINLSGVTVQGGPGDVVLENSAGNLVIEQRVVTEGQQVGEDHVGGDVTLRAAPGSAVKLATTVVPGFIHTVAANGDVTIDGTTHLNQISIVSSGGDVDFTGPIDTDPERGNRSRSLTVFARPSDDANPTKGTIRLAGDVGSVNQLRNLTLVGDTVLAGGQRNVTVTNTLLFLGKIDSAPGEGSSLGIFAGPRVEFSDDIGAKQPDTRLGGFSIARNPDPIFAGQADPLVLFGKDGDQQVLAGAGGIAFPDIAEIPSRAMVGKVRGGLTLDSDGGAVTFGENQKLTAQGDVVIAGDSVTLGDVNGLTIDIESPNTVIRARAPGPVQLAGGGTATDQGTDLVANEISFSSAPTIDGTGTVRVITPDGTATNAGELVPVALQRNVGTDDMLRGVTVLDLTALATDLPNEVPQRGPVIEGIVPLRPSQANASGSALPPGAEETLAYLRCTAAQPREACPVVPASPLDSPRGAELAQDASQFLGDSPDAVARREALARLEPGALRELAVFLTEIRLLGLSQTEYRAVRDALYSEILAGKSPAPDATAFAKAVQGQSRGVPL